MIWQKVKQLTKELLPTGRHIAVWNGKDDNGKQAASGVYFYQMKNGDYQKSRKMLLLKSNFGGYYEKNIIYYFNYSVYLYFYFL